LKRLDGKPLPPHEQMVLRTAQPTQDVQHLRRLASEQLARTEISAPANQLRLRTLQTVPWGGITTSLLPEDNKPGEKLHQLVERLSVRLGEENVTVLQAVEDHRPECMQASSPASDGEGLRRLVVSARRAEPQRSSERSEAGSLYPPWILRNPLKLSVKGDKPFYQGPLQLLTRARRLEAAWWDASRTDPAVRDYFIARSASAGLLWIFRERLAADQDRPQWFLHGLFA
jgi:protein ImuB